MDLAVVRIHRLAVVLAQEMVAGIALGRRWHSDTLVCKGIRRNCLQMR